MAIAYGKRTGKRSLWRRHQQPVFPLLRVYVSWHDVERSKNWLIEYWTSHNIMRHRNQCFIIFKPSAFLCLGWHISGALCVYQEIQWSDETFWWSIEENTRSVTIGIVIPNGTLVITLPWRGAGARETKTTFAMPTRKKAKMRKARKLHFRNSRHRPHRTSLSIAAKKEKTQR